MTTSIENRVVAMKFDNKEFEERVKTTLNSLGSLDKALKLEGATKGLHDVATAAKNFTLGHISSAVDNISERFRAMSVIGVTALATLAHQAVISGQTLVKSLTIDPLKSGFSEYETNLNSIQTILANTAAAGTKLKDVNKALQELNEYSDQTIYNFSEMAKNIGTFTAAGVDLKTATAAIKGIANLAALSGTNSEKAAGAMYQLSQAIASGKVSLMDWTSVVTAGMGGSVFQRALAQTAVAMGELDSGALKLQGSMKNVMINGKSFRDSISAEGGNETWLTSKVLTTTLKTFTGDLKDAELAALGFSKAQIKSIQDTARMAKSAATEVKTASQLMGTLREVTGSGWARTWELVFGDFEEAKELFTGANEALGSIIEASADARNAILSDWKELGGRNVLIDAVSNAWEALLSVLRPIRDAFREVFPATTGQQLYNLTYLLKSFTESLKIGDETAGNLKRTFAGVFAVLGIGWDIIKILITTLFRLFGVVGEGSGGFLEVTAKIGDFLVALRQAIKDGNVLTTVFGVIEAALTGPLKLFGLLGRAIADFFDRFDSNKAADGAENLSEKLEPLAGITGFIAKGWEKVLTVLEKVMNFLTDVVFNFIDFIGNIGTYIEEGFGGIDLSHIIGGGALLVVGGIVTKIIGLFRGGGVLGIVQQIKETIGQVTDSFGALQNSLRATTLLQIAVAIGVLTLSVMELSKVDAAGLTRALSAMTVMFAQLGGALFLFEKHLKFDDIGKMYAIVGAMAVLGVAIKILTSSVEDLAALSWEQLATGLLGVVVLLASLVGVVQQMPNDKKLIATGIALNVLAVAVKVLTSSVLDLAVLDWEALAKGLIGVGAVLGGLFLFTKFMAADKGGLAQGAGLLILAAGIKVLASAVLDLAGLTWSQLGTAMTGLASGLILIGAAVRLFPPDSLVAALGILGLAGAVAIIADSLKEMGKMSWEEIGKGLAAMAGALLLIGLAVSLIPPTAPLAAAGVLVLALSLGMIGEAFKKLGAMSWEEIGRATVALTASLGVITAALLLMPAGLAGAAALIVVTGALALLVPILLAFGQMSWEEIGKGMVVLAGFFTILGVAGAVLGAAVPALLGLGAAVALLGVGLLAAGVGIAAFSIGLKTLTLLGADGAATMELFILKLLGLIPLVMQKIGEGIIAFAAVISTAGPSITEAITTVLLAMILAIETVSPRIIEVLFKLLDLMLKELETAVPKMVRSGYKILIGVLEGIRDNISQVVTVALQIIAKFIDGIAKGLPSIIQSGVNLVISFIEGLAKAIRENSERMGKAGGELATAIIQGMVKGLGAGVGVIASKARDVAKSALNAAKNVLGINSPSKEFEKIGEFSAEGMALGLEKNSDQVSSAAESIGDDALRSLKRSLEAMSSMMNTDIDISPRIVPVLDLSGVRREASQIDGILGTSPLSVKGAILIAEDVSATQQESRRISDENDDNQTPDISFTQNNYSPKAISTADTYRDTKNLLSSVKGALPHA